MPLSKKKDEVLTKERMEQIEKDMKRMKVQKAKIEKIIGKSTK